MSSVGIGENAVSPISRFSRKMTLTAMMSATAARLAATPTTASREGREAAMESGSLVTGLSFIVIRGEIDSGSRAASASLMNMAQEGLEIVTGF
jgi:hypothetical protein